MGNWELSSKYIGKWKMRLYIVALCDVLSSQLDTTGPKVEMTFVFFNGFLLQYLGDEHVLRCSMQKNLNRSCFLTAS